MRRRNNWVSASHLVVVVVQYNTSAPVGKVSCILGPEAIAGTCDENSLAIKSGVHCSGRHRKQWS